MTAHGASSPAACGRRDHVPVRVPILTPVRCQTHLRWAQKHQNSALEQWKDGWGYQASVGSRGPTGLIHDSSSSKLSAICATVVILLLCPSCGNLRSNPASASLGRPSPCQQIAMFPSDPQALPLSQPSDRNELANYKVTQMFSRRPFLLHSAQGPRVLLACHLFYHRLHMCHF